MAIYPRRIGLAYSVISFCELRLRELLMTDVYYFMENSRRELKLSLRVPVRVGCRDEEFSAIDTCHHSSIGNGAYNHQTMLFLHDVEGFDDK